MAQEIPEDAELKLSVACTLEARNGIVLVREDKGATMLPIEGPPFQLLNSDLGQSRKRGFMRQTTQPRLQQLGFGAAACLTIPLPHHLLWILQHPHPVHMLSSSGQG